ncbi:hypothetical protein AALB16_10850 [Lachnospiraceae bacterium 62-35]
MKKITMGLLSVMTVLSLAACTPTPEKEAETAETFETMAAGGAEDKVPDPDAPALFTISIYALDDNKTGLQQEMDGVETLDAQSVIAKMIDYNILPEDTLVLGFYVPGEEEEDSSTEEAENNEEASEGINPGMFSNSPEVQTAVLNLSQIPEENRELIIASIGNTFTENFNVGTLQIQIMDEQVAEVSYNDNY